MLASGTSVIVSVKRNKEFYDEQKAEVLSKSSRGYKVRMLTGPKAGEKRDFPTTSLRAEERPEKKKKTAEGLFDGILRE